MLFCWFRSRRSEEQTATVTDVERGESDQKGNQIQREKRRCVVLRNCLTIASWCLLAVAGAYHDWINQDLKYAVGVPESSTLVLLCIGAVGMRGGGWRKRCRQ